MLVCIHTFGWRYELCEKTTKTTTTTKNQWKRLQAVTKCQKTKKMKRFSHLKWEMRNVKWGNEKWDEWETKKLVIIHGKSEKTRVRFITHCYAGMFKRFWAWAMKWCIRWGQNWNRNNKRCLRYVFFLFILIFYPHKLNEVKYSAITV